MGGSDVRGPRATSARPHCSVAGTLAFLVTSLLLGPPCGLCVENTPRGGVNWETGIEIHTLLIRVCFVISDSETPWAAAHQAPLSTGFSRQECWSGLPFPPPGDLPDPGNEPISPEFPAPTGRFFTTEPPV